MSTLITIGINTHKLNKHKNLINLLYLIKALVTHTKTHYLTQLQELKYHTSYKTKENSKHEFSYKANRTHNTRIRWFQTSKNQILITQIHTYPKHEKFGITFTLESIPTLLTLSYLG
jgi:hypothetical protein